MRKHMIIDLIFYIKDFLFQTHLMLKVSRHFE
jgi:hypothetical protein